MTPVSSLVVAAIKAFVVSNGIFFLFLFIGAYIGLLGWGFMSKGVPVTPFDTPIIYFCLLMLAVSLLICPVAAYQNRERIFEITESPFVRTFLFGVVGSSQIAFLITLILGVVAYATYSEKKGIRNIREARASFEALSRKLDEADIQVTVEKAKILQDNGRFIVAEITLSVKNVPHIMPEYTLNIFYVNDQKGFVIGYNRASSKSLINTWIKAMDRDAQWVFQDRVTNKIISESEDHITFEIDFERETAGGKELPLTISPRLGIFHQSDNSYVSNHVFFLRPIPIKFDKSS